MIREKTGLIGFYILFLLFSIIYLSQADLLSLSAGRFWQIIFRFQSRGSYKVTSGKVEGNYTLTQEWLGFLEEDGPDFIIYHLEVRLISWDFTEKTSDGFLAVSLNGKDKIKKNINPKPPEFRMEYIKGEEKEICFYFSLDSLPIPINKKPGQQEWLLAFPSIPWEEKNMKEIGLKKKITGRKRVSLSREKLELPEYQENFGWEEKTSLQSSNAESFSQEHQVQISVFFIRGGIKRYQF
ncbi:MAG: hypothetical protein JHC32_04805 [Candidatus Aminicenantes bacterium]|nr:hypothetical protein [Candidatus Aminicenantes bacterium]